eukprot:scaffold77192_cov37-Cyclotella_meneghiniana.AAC.9
MKDNHTFGCPVFALQNALAAGSTIPKWSPRARMGMNLGPSPYHARNVNLVLNLETGLVSPQFHCRYDDFFETVQLGQAEVVTSSTWQVLSGLKRPDRTPTVENNSETQRGDFVESLRTTRILSFENDGDIPNQISEDSGSTVFDHNSPMQVSEGATPSPSSLSAGTSACGRQRKMSRAMAESVSQREFYGKSNMHYMASRASTNNEERFAEDHDQHLSLQERMRNPIAFHAEMMGDIMYFHQASIRQPDAAEFVNAVVKEINGHIDNNRWQLVKRSEVPEGIDVIPSHKARLNIHGGKQVYGVNYFDTCAPVVTWFAIRLLIVFSIIYKQALRQVDFVQAYPQAPIDTDMYMELPQGVETKYGNSKDHVLKLLSNLYGQKQAGRVWNQFMVEKLLSVGFKQSLIDECVFYRDDVIFIVYVDDGIFLGSTDEQLVGVIQEIQDAGLNVEDQGHPADYVGVNIKRLKDGSFEFTQRALIDAIIDDVQLGDAFTKPVPAKVSLQLHSFYNSPPFDLNFNYRSVVGELNYLAQTARPDIMYAVHQIASADPRKEHGEAILYLVRYLKKTRHLGLKFKPDESKGFDCYCDADFSGNWNSLFASADPSTAKSRSGWIVALSTTEAEYIALSMSLRDVIPIMQLIDEMKERKFPVICTLPDVYCKVFEDNSNALELAKLPKLRTLPSFS